MQYTNLFKLPGPLVEAIKGDQYNEERGKLLNDYKKLHNLPETTPHFSVNDLIRPPRMRVLQKRYSEKIIIDVCMSIYRVLGQAIHNLLQSSAGKDYIAEERMFAHMVIDGRTVIVSGEPDLVTPEGELHDYKVTQVFSWEKGVKTEWEQQVNSYAWMRSLVGNVTTGLKICFILRDWSVSETVKEGYPKAGAQMLDVKQWSFDEQQAWVEGRIRLHLEAESAFDDDLIECTQEEMWEKPEHWAVMREGANRSSKNVYKPGEEGLHEAQGLVDERNQKLKPRDKPFFVEHRPGERTRCLRFCDARAFCSQFKEYSQASFKGEKLNV